MKKSIYVMVLIMLIIPSFLSNIFFVDSQPISDIIYVDINGDEDFTSIQLAIDAANNNDTIFIKKGEYNEQLFINKSINLIGEDKTTTIIKGIGQKDVIFITAEQVHIEHIQICNSGSSGRDAGIESNANYTSIIDTVITNTTIGIFLYQSSHHLIENNTLINNRDYGLHLYSSYQNDIIRNKIFDNSWGVLLVYGQGNRIMNNQIIDNKNEGLWLLRGSVFNTIENNYISSNHKGIHLQLFSYNNSIVDNTISYNDEGIRIGSYWACDSNIIQGNTITNNQKYGIYLLDSVNTQITENTFSENSIHAFFSDCENSYWNKNYWKSSESAHVIKGKKNHIPWFNVDWNPAQTPYPSSAEFYDDIIQNSSKSRLQTKNDLPEKFSWTNVDGIDYTTPVKNQIPTPSCEAYALCGALETLVHYKLQKNIGCDLSEAHLFCYPGGTAAWGVDVTEPAEYLIDYGVPDEGCFPDPHRPYDYPYESIAGWENRTVKIHEWGWVDNNIDAIKQAIIDHGPLTICQMTRRDLDYYKSGVYMPSLFSPIQRGHVTAIFGYDDEEQCFLIRNSGGETWGEEGYFRIAYNGFKEIYSFIYPFYGGSGILYIEDVYGNLEPDVPIVEISKPQCYKTYVNGVDFDTIYPYISSIQNGAPRIFGSLTVSVETEKTDYIEFYIDNMLQFTDSSNPFNWGLSCSKGLHELMVIAYKEDSISKDVVDIFIF